MHTSVYFLFSGCSLLKATGTFLIKLHFSRSSTLTDGRQAGDVGVEIESKSHEIVQSSAERGQDPTKKGKGTRLSNGSVSPLLRAWRLSAAWWRKAEEDGGRD